MIATGGVFLRTGAAANADPATSTTQAVVSHVLRDNSITAQLLPTRPGDRGALAIPRKTPLLKLIAPSTQARGYNGCDRMRPRAPPRVRSAAPPGAENPSPRAPRNTVPTESRFRPRRATGPPWARRRAPDERARNSRP